jgi:hypothetical protein
MAMPAQAERKRHARVHQRERAAADGGHGRGTVGFENVGDQPHGVGEIGFRRKQIDQGPLGQRAVADFATSRTAQELHFADGKRREVVVQHEALEGFVLEQQVQALHVFLGAEGERGQGLGFAAGEERRAVHARQQADFAGDLANLVEGAAVRTAIMMQDVVAEELLAQALEGAVGELVAFSSSSGRGRGFPSLVRRQACSFLLGMLGGVEGVVQARAEFLVDFLGQLFVERPAAARRPSSVSVDRATDGWRR